MSYKNLVTKKKQYKYSANICFDIKDEEKLSGFIPNITTTEIFREYLLGIIRQNSDIHSRILYGSYGTGKSHLLTVLSDILGHINTDGKGINEFLGSIKKYDKELASEIGRFVKEQKPYLVVPIYSNFKEFDKCITFSLKKELERNNIPVCFKSYFDDALDLITKWKIGEESASRLQEICKKHQIDVEELCRGLESYNSSSERSFEIIFKSMTFGAPFVNGTGNLLDNIELANSVIKDEYRGIVFIFDEFGRYIEDSGEEIQVKQVQDLAEFCDHSDYDDHLILVSHKVLSLYTDKMKKSLSDEWKKIEGRFKATSINAKYDQCLSLIPHIIPKTRAWNGFKKKFEQNLNELYEQAYDFKGFLLPPEEEGVIPFEGGFPLHPITLYSLDRLSKKVAQNERTFFTYLASDEEYSLFAQLAKMNDEEFHFIGLDAIYDYFEENICAYRTDEIYNIYKKLQFAINKLGNSRNHELEIKILKVIGVIYIIGDSATLSADARTLVNVIDADNINIQNAISNLEKMKVIKYMRQYGYYDFLDSSIYDFDSMIEDKMTSVTDDVVITILNEEFSNFALYPHEYNLRYHINRNFFPVFAQRGDLIKKSFMRFVPKYYDGIVAFILDAQYSIDNYKTIDTLPERTLLIINRNANEIFNEIKRYVAIKYFYSIREELKKNDPTVEKELTLYLEEQNSVITAVIDQWKKVTGARIHVLYNGEEQEVKNSRDFSKIESKIMQEAYPETIIVNYDLINKNTITGAMKIARFKALGCIMNDENILDNCSLLSPEHTIIRSVLSKNGIFEDSTVSIKNILPNGTLAGIPVKKAVDRYLNSCAKGQVPLSELYDRLKRAPYGLRDGYISVILAYELKKYSNVSLYFHGSEHDYCEEELLKALDSPDDYSFYICSWSNEQSTYISELEGIFDKFINKTVKNRLKELLAAMNKHFIGISKSARTTNRYVSDVTKRYREIMSITHKDYNRFFFETLLQINGDMQELVIQMKAIVRDLENVTSLQLDTLDKAVRRVLNITIDDSIIETICMKYETDWKEKRFKAFDYQTSAVLDYLETLNPNISEVELIQEIGRIVTGFEVEYWNDSKVEDFYNAFSKIAIQLDVYEIKDRLGADEIKIAVTEGNDTEKITQFNKAELSGNGKVMFNKMKATIENFGEALSYEEKMYVLAKLFSEMM